MATIEDRKRRGAEILKRYKAISGTDQYACASDAIADILLSVSQSQDEGVQLLQAAEMDFCAIMEGETFLTEG